MYGYINIIQNGIKKYWKYDINLLDGKLFDCPEDGLKYVLDNVCRAQQRNGAYTKKSQYFDYLGFGNFIQIFITFT